MNNKRILELKEQISDLLKRWPAHSVPPAMVQELDDLEEELALELEKKIQVKHNAKHKNIIIHPIGYVENEFDLPAAPENIRGCESTIILNPDLTEGLLGLEVGQQVMVIFNFHLSEGCNLLQHPRGDVTRSQRGVFALRSPNRPNPIGVSIADILKVEGNKLHVRGLDAINQTPVLDLKPA